MNVGIMIDSLEGGGAEKVAKIVSDYLLQQGDQVFLFIFARKGKGVFQLSGQVVFFDEVPVRDNRGRAVFYEDLFRTGRKIKRIKKKYHIESTLSFMEKANMLNVLSRAQDRVIISIHTILSVRKELTGPFYDRQNLHFLYSKADRIITLSEDGRRELTEYYALPSNLVTVLPNPIADYLFDTEDRQWIYGSKCIVTVARLDPVKQQDHLIRAFSKVVEKYPDACLILCGQGLLEGYLRGLAKNLSIEENVIFPGFTREVPYFLKHARAFVLTSKCEGFPLSMIEAMQSGTPVIASAMPGGANDILQSAVTGSNLPQNVCIELETSHKKEVHFSPYGLITPALRGTAKLNSALDDGEEALAQAMILLLENEELYQYYSAKSRERARYYNPEKVLEEWIHVISTREGN